MDRYRYRQYIAKRGTLRMSWSKTPKIEVEAEIRGFLLQELAAKRITHEGDRP